MSLRVLDDTAELPAQRTRRPEDQALHRTHRRVQRVGDVAIRHAVDPPEQKGRALVQRQLIEHALDLSSDLDGGELLRRILGHLVGDP